MWPTTIVGRLTSPNAHDNSKIQIVSVLLGGQKYGFEARVIVDELANDMLTLRLTVPCIFSWRSWRFVFQAAGWQQDLTF
jgi:hypothetical protein